ncbi:MAG: L-threonylcarbamoyladenylate synthase, partial [Flavobacteriales bacterium]
MNKNTLQEAVEYLKDGKVILYPADTIWGLGCDATNEEAVAKLLKIKKRDTSKSQV